MELYLDPRQTSAVTVSIYLDPRQLLEYLDPRQASTSLKYASVPAAL